MIFQNGVPATENQFIGKNKDYQFAKSFMGKIIPDYVISMVKCQKYY